MASDIEKAFNMLHGKIQSMAMQASRLDTVQGLNVEVAPNPDEGGYHERVVWLVLHSGGYERIWSNNQHFFYLDTSYSSLQEAYDAVVEALEPMTVDDVIEAGEELKQVLGDAVDHLSQALIEGVMGDLGDERRKAQIQRAAQRWDTVVSRFNTTR